MAFNFFCLANCNNIDIKSQILCTVKMLIYYPKFYYTLGCPTTFNISWQCIYSIDFQKNGDGSSYRVNSQNIGGTYADAPSMLGTPDYDLFNMSNTVICSNYNNVV